MPKRNNLGDFELMVMLALLRLGNDAYGVPISREIEQQSGREVALGSVHATLERLEGRGLVTSHLGKPTAERGGKAKRYFPVTSNGLRKTREIRHSGGVGPFKWRVHVAKNVSTYHASSAGRSVIRRRNTIFCNT